MTLVELIHRRGTTQRAVAARLGVTEATVSRWCSRVHAIPMRHVEPLARFLRAEITQIVAVGPSEPRRNGKEART